MIEYACKSKGGSNDLCQSLRSTCEHGHTGRRPDCGARLFFPPGRIDYESHQIFLENCHELFLHCVGNGEVPETCGKLYNSCQGACKGLTPDGQIGGKQPST